MRIAFDARTVQGARRGMGGYAHSLLAEFARRGANGDITLLTDPALPDLPADIASGYRIARVGGPGGTVLWEQWYLPLALRSFDLLHSPANSAPLRSPIPVVLTLHDAIFMRKLRDISRHTYLRQIAGHLYRKNVLSRASRRARLVLTVSEASRRGIMDRLGIPAERVVVSGEALPDSFMQSPASTEAEIRARFGLEPGYLMALGAYEKRKNIPLLFRMLERLPGRTLVLAGADNLRASGYEAEVRRKGLAGRVRFLPFISLPELKGLYSCALVFLFPSREEGFGLPILESMHCGTPVIAADMPASAETSGGVAVLLDPNDDARWAAAVENIATDGAVRNKLAMGGKAHAGSFKWDSVADLTLKSYNTAADSPS